MSFPFKKWWFSTVMLVYQRVTSWLQDCVFFSDQANINPFCWWLNQIFWRFNPAFVGQIPHGQLVAGAVRRRRNTPQRRATGKAGTLWGVPRVGFSSHQKIGTIWGFLKSWGIPKSPQVSILRWSNDLDGLGMSTIEEPPNIWFIYIWYILIYYIM